MGAEEDESSDFAPETGALSAWDIAVRYHEFKTALRDRDSKRDLRHISAQAVLERAKKVLGSVVRPTTQQTLPWSELGADAINADLDFEHTLEEAPLGLTRREPLLPKDIWMEHQIHRTQPVMLAIDTSLSMTGEKLALTAVALAVVLLEFPNDPIGIVAFENAATILKEPTERIGISELLERFLDVPAQGYTHLEDGMKKALQMSNAASNIHAARPPSTVLLTDGKYTAGKDPAYLAPRFPHLVVVKMGKDRGSLGLCQELAQKGRGTLKEVGELEELPSVMYEVVKDLLRGRSIQ